MIESIVAATKSSIARLTRVFTIRVKVDKKKVHRWRAKQETIIFFFSWLGKNRNKEGK